MKVARTCECPKPLELFEGECFTCSRVLVAPDVKRLEPPVIDADLFRRMYANGATVHGIATGLRVSEMRVLRAVDAKRYREYRNKRKAAERARQRRRGGAK